MQSNRTGFRRKHFARFGCAMAALLLAAATATAQTTWNDAVNGDWNTPGNWSAGVPNNNAANLTPTGNDYTVTVNDPPANPFTDLTVQNAGSDTTTLEVNAGEFTSNNGILTFGQGATVKVNSEGEMHYPGVLASGNVFVDIKDGGVWHVNGGKVAFTNMPAGTGRHYAYVGNASEGRMQIDSGTVRLTAAAGNNLVQLRVGVGNGGKGRLIMNGGLLEYFNNGNYGFYVADSAGAYGEIVLTNNAAMSVVNYGVYGSGANATGTVTVAGNATMTITGGRQRVGSGLNGTGIITVKDNGFLEEISPGQGFFLGGHNSGGGSGARGVFNVYGGTAKPRIIHAGYGYDGQTGYGEVNVTNGALLVEHHLNVGYPRQPNSPGHAIVNLSGGVMTLGSSLRIAYSEMTPDYQAYGELNVSGGVITNSGEFVIGHATGATGLVTQTGGDIRHLASSAAYPLRIGANGGVGTYTMSDGTYESSRDVYVGGGGFYEADSTRHGTGTLHVAGGTFTLASNRDLYVGAYGNGRVTVGGGTLSARNFELASQDATLGFEFSAGAIGGCNVSGTLTIDPDAKLEIDTTGAASNVKYTLVSCASRSGIFDIANITVLGGSAAWVDQDTDQNIYFTIPAGTVIMLR